MNIFFIALMVSTFSALYILIKKYRVKDIMNQKLINDNIFIIEIIDRILLKNSLSISKEADFEVNDARDRHIYKTTYPSVNLICTLDNTQKTLFVIDEKEITIPIDNNFEESIEKFILEEKSLPR